MTEKTEAKSGWWARLWRWPAKHWVSLSVAVPSVLGFIVVLLEKIPVRAALSPVAMEFGRLMGQWWIVLVMWVFALIGGATFVGGMAVFLSLRWSARQRARDAARIRQDAVAGVFLKYLVSEERDISIAGEPLCPIHKRPLTSEARYNPSIGAVGARKYWCEKCLSDGFHEPLFTEDRATFKDFAKRELAEIINTNTEHEAPIRMERAARELQAKIDKASKS